MTDLDYDSLYVLANKILDENVFTDTEGYRLLEMYNAREDDDARVLLFSIVDDMIESAYSGVVKAMQDVIASRKNELVAEIEWTGEKE